MAQPPNPQHPWHAAVPPGWPPPPPASPPAGWPGSQYPPAGAGWTAAPGADWPPTQPRKPRRAWPWVGGVGVAVTAITALVTIAVRHDGGGGSGGGGGAALRPGQCVSSDDYAAYRMQPTDCDDPAAVYEFAGTAAMSICPDGNQTQDGAYFLEAPDQHSDVLCFALNLRQGSCYLWDLSAKTVTPLDCSEASSRATSTAGAVKVAERVDGSSDGSRCAPEAKAMVFAVPARVYCLAKAG